MKIVIHEKHKEQDDVQENGIFVIQQNKRGEIMYVDANFQMR